ncbi:TPA: hypothetical protein DEA21_05330 [Candidatus Uhrbacteria bacterium]|nr:hypothetical protein [Candidatus Uhrbacteria bacterium]
MAGALLSSLFPGIRFVRTRDEEKLAEAKESPTAIVFDVDGEFDTERLNFDHHQREGAPAPRENGVRYSSFGLLWRQFGVDYCRGLIEEFGLTVDTEELAELIDVELVQGIDTLDAGGIDDPRFRPMVGSTPVEIKTFGLALFELAPQPLLYEQPDYNSAYLEAVEMTKRFLRKFAESCLAKLYGRQLIRAGRRVKECIVVSPKIVPDWSDVVSVEFEETLFYLEPDPSDPTGQAYMIWQVPTAPRAFSGRKPLPESWAGKRGSDLEAVTGIPGAGFCHDYRFVGGGKNIEAALAMARAAILA